MSIAGIVLHILVRVVVVREGQPAARLPVTLGSETGQTGDDGVVLFPGTAAGTYRLVAGSAELSVVVSSELEDIVLDLSSPRGISPAFGRSALTRQFLARLPHAWTVSTVLETLEPLAVTDRIDVAGSESRSMPRWSVRGSSFTQNRVLVDGSDLTDPSGGGSLYYPDVELFDQVVLEHAGAAGTELRFVTRKMPSRHGGSAAVRYSGSGLQSQHRGAESTELVRFPNGRLELGSPQVYGAVHGFVLRTTEGETSFVGATAKLGLGSGSLFGSIQKLENERFLFVRASRQAARLSYARAALDPGRAMLSSPVRELTSSNPPSLDRSGLRDRFHVSVAREWVVSRHYLRAALELSRASEHLVEHVPGGVERLTVDGEAHAVSEYFGSGELRVASHRFAVDVEDAWFLGGFRLEPSLRFDVSHSGSIRWASLSGRVAAHFALGGAARVHAAFGRYPHMLTSRLPAASEGGLSWVWRRWTDRDGDLSVSEDEVGEPLRRGGAAFTILARDLPRPFTQELAFGFERRFRKGFFRMDAYHRWDERLLETSNVGISLESYEPFSFVDVGIDGVAGTSDDNELTIFDQNKELGRDRFVVMHPPGHSSFSQGVELLAGFGHGPLSWRLSARAYRDVGHAGVGNGANENDTGVLGGLFDDPNHTTNAEGRLFFDRAFTGKLAATGRAPGGIDLGLVVRYWDGQPFARHVFFPKLGQGFTVVQALPRGRQRFTFNMTVDLRVERTFSAGAARWSLALNAFNLFNQALETQEDVRSGSHFREPTRVQPGRTLLLEARLQF